MAKKKLLVKEKDLHLQIQRKVLTIFPAGEASLEVPFPSIHRIADIYWERRKIVFEIQCSPISMQEAQDRCRDYRSLGIIPVWLLHLKTFGKRFAKEGEIFLRMTTPTYYIDDHYRFFDREEKYPHRLHEVDLSRPKRGARGLWPLRFQGDFRKWSYKDITQLTFLRSYFIL